MKLRAADLERQLAAGRSRPKAILLHGEDAALAAQLREGAIVTVAGPEADAEMRVTRLTGAQCRSDPAALDSALRARGFFAGDSVVVVTEAADSLAAPLVAAAREAAGPEALLVVVAGLLTAKSALRKAFESDPVLAAVTCDRVAPGRAEVAAALAAQGVDRVEPEALDELVRLMADLDGLAQAGLLGKLALWQHGADAPLDLAGVAACAAPAGSVDADTVFLAVLSRDPVALQGAMARALGQGSDAVGLVLMLGRLARQVLEARVLLDDRGGSAEAALGRVFPPLPWPLRAPVARWLPGWHRVELEGLVRATHDLDATLRRGGREPVAALVGRTLLRAVLARRR